MSRKSVHIYNQSYTGERISCACQGYCLAAIEAGRQPMMHGGPLHTSQYWHNRAEEAHARAEEMHDIQAKGTMQSIAALYDRKAERSADRERGKK
jgi:hypothetical protein